MNHSVLNRIKQLDAYFARAVDKNLLEELQSDLSRHGVVLVCGFIERSVEIIVTSKFERPKARREARFIRAYFRQGTNYNCEAIKQLLDKFDPVWGKKFENFAKGRDDVVQGVISAYALRNSIAHGGSGNIGIHGALALFQAAKDAIEGMWKSTL